jgi:hypothetical protein
MGRCCYKVGPGQGWQQRTGWTDPRFGIDATKRCRISDESPAIGRVSRNAPKHSATGIEPSSSNAARRRTRSSGGQDQPA